MFKFASAARNGHSFSVLPSTIRPCHRRRETARARHWATGHVVQWNLGAIYLRLSTLRQVLDQPHLKRLVRDTACPGKGRWAMGKGTGAPRHHGTTAPRPQQAIVPRFVMISLGSWWHGRTYIVCHGGYASLQTHVGRATLARQHLAHRGPHATFVQLCRVTDIGLWLGMLRRPSYQPISLSRA